MLQLHPFLGIAVEDSVLPHSCPGYLPNGLLEHPAQGVAFEATTVDQGRSSGTLLEQHVILLIHEHLWLQSTSGCNSRG